MKACYIRPIVYRGYAALGVNPFPCPIDAAILLWEWGTYLGADALENGVDVKVSSWSRMAPDTFPSLAKTSANYANAAAHQDGGHRRRLRRGHRARQLRASSAKGSGQNIFVVRDGVLYTPPMAAVDPARASRGTRSSRWRGTSATACTRR